MEISIRRYAEKIYHVCLLYIFHRQISLRHLKASKFETIYIINPVINVFLDAISDYVVLFKLKKSNDLKDVNNKTKSKNTELG